MPLPLWTRLLLALAGLEIGAGLAGILAAALTGVGSSGQPFPLWVFALQICVFAAAGTTLLLGTRGDPRVALLGAALMLIATSYCRRPFEFLELWSGGHPAVRLVGPLQLDAFLPAFVWMFAREFPRALDSPASRRVGRLAVLISLGVGIALFAANLALLAPGLRETFSFVAARNNGSLRPRRPRARRTGDPPQGAAVRCGARARDGRRRCSLRLDRLAGLFRARSRWRT